MASQRKRQWQMHDTHFLMFSATVSHQLATSARQQRTACAAANSTRVGKLHGRNVALWGFVLHRHEVSGALLFPTWSFVVCPGFWRRHGLAWCCTPHLNKYERLLYLVGNLLPRSSPAELRLHRRLCPSITKWTSRASPTT
jgi:hypothetical protein